MTDLMSPPPEHDLPPGRADDIRRAVLRSAGPTPRPAYGRRVLLALPVAAAVVALVLIGLRLTQAPPVVGAPSPTPAAPGPSLPPDSVETDAGPLDDAEARAAVAGLDVPPDLRPAALADVLVARRLTTALGDGTFVVFTDVAGSTWFGAEIPGHMRTAGPISGPAAKRTFPAPDGDHPVTRLSDLEMFGWRMDADRPDATARDLHTEQLYVTSPDVVRVEVRMTVEGRPGPWFSAPVHAGYAFVPAVTPGPHSTTEDVDKVTSIEDRALGPDGRRVSIRAA